jgi:hypothetical protein
VPPRPVNCHLPCVVADPLACPCCRAVCRGWLPGGPGARASPAQGRAAGAAGEGAGRWKEMGSRGLPTVRATPTDPWVHGGARCPLTRAWPVACQVLEARLVAHEDRAQRTEDRARAAETRAEAAETRAEAAETRAQVRHPATAPDSCTWLEGSWSHQRRCYYSPAGHVSPSGVTAQGGSGGVAA